MSKASPDELTVFRSDALRKCFLQSYDAALAAWPTQPESRFVPTPFGETHVLSSGPEGGRSVVMLPGLNTGATLWGAVLEPLAKRCRVHCIDLPGDSGRSRPSRPLRHREESKSWLSALLDGLELDSTAVVGASLGAYLAACFALDAPGRVERLGLVAPAATLSSVGGWFLLKGIGAVLLPTRDRQRRFTRWLSRSSGLFGDPHTEQMLVGMRAVRSRVRIMPRSLSNGELEQLSMPTLVVIGEHEVMNRSDAVTAAQRAEACLAQCRVEVVDGASHIVTKDAPAAVARLLDEFLV